MIEDKDLHPRMRVRLLKTTNNSLLGGKCGDVICIDSNSSNTCVQIRFDDGSYCWTLSTDVEAVEDPATATFTNPTRSLLDLIP